MRRVAIITNMPSGYQAELLGALSREAECEIHALFLRRMTPGRQWERLPENDYPHTFIREVRVHPHFYLNVGLFNTLRQLQPDLIVVTQYASIGMQLVMYAASALRKPWVFWSERPGVEHTELPIFRSDRLRRAFRYISLFPVRHWPAQIWGIGKRATRYYAEISRVPCFNVPYCSDLKPFFGIEPRQFNAPIRFLYSGKLNRRKGVDLLVPTIDRLLHSGCNFSFTFMGDGPMRGMVEELAGRWADRVRYIGFKELDQIEGVLREHDVLVCSSRYDGWGMVVPEALAAGMPVLATRGVGAAIDMIEDGRNGYLVDADSEGALLRAMTDMAQLESGRLLAMASAARETSRRYHNIPAAHELARRISEVQLA